MNIDNNVFFVPATFIDPDSINNLETIHDTLQRLKKSGVSKELVEEYLQHQDPQGWWRHESTVALAAIVKKLNRYLKTHNPKQDTGGRAWTVQESIAIYPERGTAAWIVELKMRGETSPFFAEESDEFGLWFECGDPECGERHPVLRFG